MKKIINIYIFKEMVPTFITGLILFTFLVLAGRVLKLTEWMVNHGTDISQVLLIIVYTIPYVLFFTLPMATLLGSLIAFSRLNEDNEIIALKSCGISLYQILPPVVTFSILSYLLASFIAIYLFPIGNHSMSRLLFEIAQSNTSIGIKQGVFNDNIPNIVLYANHISSHDQTMEGVFIFDERDPSISNTIIARKGRIISDPKKMSINLHLIDGSSFMVSKDLDSSRKLQFTSYDLRIELEDIMRRFSSRMKGEKEMSISELRAHLKKTKKATVKYNILAIELQRKFSIPFACLLLGLIGFPLGLMMRAQRRSWGIALSIVIFVVYYILLSAADSLGETGTLNPVIAMWIPNMVLGAATFVLFWRATQET
ncbi:MAG: LPS export ABC transporter permease LptF [Deltaproteobacteria bacterium]|nr:LPS export ABC transporter permease LptF [Deltaproteobacteria bacterium]